MANYSRITGSITVQLPSSPGCEITGPSYLTWRMRTAINAAASRVQRDDEGEALETFSPTLLQYHLVEQWILHKDADWNLYLDGQKLPRTKESVDEYLQADDVSFVAFELMRHFYPGMFSGDASAEGEVEKPEKSDDSGEKGSSASTRKGKASA